MNLITWTLKEVTSYLKSIKLINENNVVNSFEVAGPGNMNYTFRASIDNGSSYIIKQAPEFCAKFPQIPAPIERIFVEVNFYRCVNGIDTIKDFFPKVYAIDRENHTAVIEDLGSGEDMGRLYKNQLLSEENILHLSRVLSEINSIELADPILNTKMKELNFSHIFSIPLTQDNGLNLDKITPGLSSLKEKLLKNTTYIKRVNELGQIYLAQGKYLLHGDFYPNSWLENDNLSVIDPEFAFTGAVEFDLGNFIAHLIITKHSKEDILLALKFYKPTGGYKQSLALEFAGVEIMRRLLGYAQLPIDYSLEEKKNLLLLSEALLMKPSLEELHSI